jgi:hypothetical protein
MPDNTVSDTIRVTGQEIVVYVRNPASMMAAVVDEPIS